MDFGAARQIRAFLIKRWTPSRHPDILDETPPYPVTETGRSETTSFFKKLFGSLISWPAPYSESEQARRLAAQSY